MSTAVANASPQNGGVTTKPERVEATLAGMVEKFRSVLPTEMPAERFCRVAINALQDPRVAECAQTPEGRQSIVTEATNAATDGLLLDKREAFLNVYKTKVGNDWIPLVKYMPMYQGLLKLIRNSDLIRELYCDVVRQGDLFAVDQFPMPGTSPVTHQYPDDPFARGEPRGVYAVVFYKDGTWSKAEVMSVADVEKIRQISPAKDKDAWSKHWAEMAKKTVTRRLSKWLPKSTDGMERFHAAAQRGDDYRTIQGVAGTTEQPRKKMMASTLLSQPAPKAAEPERPQIAAPATPTPEPVKEQKPAAKQAQQEVLPKEEKKANKAKAPPPPADEGFDERDGGYVDPLTGESVEDDDGI